LCESVIGFPTLLKSKKALHDLDAEGASIEHIIKERSLGAQITRNGPKSEAF